MSKRQAKVSDYPDLVKRMTADLKRIRGACCCEEKAAILKKYQDLANRK